MKEGWTYKKLGEICETLNGLWKGKKPPYVNVGVIRNANFTKEFTIRFDNIEYLDVEERQYAKRKLYKDDLIIEKSGGGEKQPVGRAVLFEKEDGEYSFSNFTSVLRIKNKHEWTSRFLYLYLYFIYKRGDTLSMQKATTGIHNIEFDKYLNIEVPFLPLSEQQRIVSRLDAAFAHIDELKANAEKQLNEARALFQKALTKAMEPKNGWEEKKLGEVCNVVGGGTPDTKNKDYWGGNIPWATVSDMNCEIIKSTGYFITDRGLNESSSRIIKTGEIVIATRVGLGKVCKLAVDTAINQDLKGIIPKDNRILRDFIFYYFKHKANYIIDNGIGATVKGVKIKFIEGLPFGVPPLSEQQRIVSRLDSLSAHVRELEEVLQKTIAECDALKQALLRKVFE